MFVEQPLASPGSAKNPVFPSSQDSQTSGNQVFAILLVYKLDKVGPKKQILENSEQKDHIINEWMNQLMTKVFVEQPRLHRVC